MATGKKPASAAGHMNCPKDKNLDLNENKVISENSFSFKRNHHTGISIGQNKNNNSEHATQLVQRLVKQLDTAFNQLPEWIEDYKNLIYQNEHQKAFELLNEHAFWSVPFRLKSLNFTNMLIKLNPTVLTPENRKTFYENLFYSAGHESRYGIIEYEIEKYLEEFGNAIEEGLKQNIELCYANSLAENQKFPLAIAMYENLLEKNSLSLINTAYAYRGLGIIAEQVGSFKDLINYKNKELDKWREAGDFQGIISTLMTLAQIKGLDNPEHALNYIDEAVHIVESLGENISSRKADLIHFKARYLMGISKYSEALEACKQAIKLIEELINTEIMEYSLHSLAVHLAELLGLKSESIKYKEKVESIAQKIDVPHFKLQLEISIKLGKGEVLDKEMMQKIENSEDLNLKFGAYLSWALNSNLTFFDKLRYVEKARAFENKLTKPNRALLYEVFANIYEQEQKIEKAIDYYKQSLQFNEWAPSVAQKYAALLMKDEQWEDLKSFCKKRIEKFGPLPNLTYVYARSLMECGDYNNALPLFCNIKDKLQFDITEYINLCASKAEISTSNAMPQQKESFKPSVSYDELYEVLKLIGCNISRDSRMTFWKKEAKKKKWCPHPEEHAKHLVLQALSAKFGDNGIRVIREVSTGAGRMDLFVILRGGLSAIIELKMCGLSYSLDYALMGEKQLEHYQENTDAHMVFLMIFDGRSRENGKGITSKKMIKNYTLYSIPINLKPDIL